MCDQPYWHRPRLICGENAVKSSVPFNFMVFYNTYTDPSKSLDNLSGFAPSAALTALLPKHDAGIGSASIVLNDPINPLCWTSR